MPSLDPSLDSIYFFCLWGRLWMAKLTRAAGMKVPVVPFERKWSHSATDRKLHQAQMQREDVHDFSVQNSLLIFISSDRRLNFVLLQTHRAGGSSWPYSHCQIITTFCLLTGWPGGKRFEGVFLEWDMSRSLRASSSYKHSASVLEEAYQGNVAVCVYFLAFVCLNHFNIECVWAVKMVVLRVLFDRFSHSPHSLLRAATQPGMSHPESTGDIIH